MKNSIVIHLVTPYLFNTGSWIYSQLNGLKNFRSVVYTQSKENLDQFPMEDIYSADDFSSIKMLINRIYRRTTDRYGLFFTNLTREISPNLFHAHMGHEGVRWFKLAQKTGVPLITTFYGEDVSKLGKLEYWQKRYAELFKYGIVFLTEGNYLKKQLMNLGCPEEKIIVQHLGIDIDKYPVRKTRKNEKIIITQVSTFREKKGIEYSLQSIAKLVKNYSNIEFRLIGKGSTLEEDSNIKNKIHKLGIQNFVRLYGALPHNQMIKELYDADIFLHPSVTARDGDNEGGAPVGIIEASGVGLPVISTFHADIPEVILDGETGYLVNERDGEKLADKLSILIESSEKRLTLGENGRKYITKEYNLKIQIQKLESIYESCI